MAALSGVGVVPLQRHSVAQKQLRCRGPTRVPEVVAEAQVGAQRSSRPAWQTEPLRVQDQRGIRSRSVTSGVDIVETQVRVGQGGEVGEIQLEKARQQIDDDRDGSSTIVR
jgi:hypothetical protein